MLARRLGAHEFGVYSSAIGVAGYVGLVADGGLFATISRLLARTRERELHRRMLGAASITFALSAVVCGVGMLVITTAAGPLFSAELRTLLLQVSFLAGGSIAAYATEQMLKGSGHRSILALITFSRQATLFLLVLVLTSLGASTTMVVSAALGIGIASFVIAAVVTLPLWPTKRAAWAPILREHRAFGRSLFLGRSANLLAFRSDVFLLVLLWPSRSVAHYVLAVALLTPVSLLAQSNAVARFRGMAGQPAESRSTWGNLLQCGLAALLVTPTAWVLVETLLGSEYRPVLTLLPLVALGTVLQAAYQPSNSWLLVNSRGHSLGRMLGITAVINLTANLALVPALGPVGGAIASVVGNGSYFLLSIRTVRRESVTNNQFTDQANEGIR